MNKAESERARERRLIMENLSNGVSVDDIARAYRRDAKDVLADMRFVVQKIQAYCLTHGMTMVKLDDVGAIRAHRQYVRWILERVKLDILPAYSKITVDSLDGQNIKELRIG